MNLAKSDQNKLINILFIGILIFSISVLITSLSSYSNTSGKGIFTILNGNFLINTFSFLLIIIPFILLTKSLPKSAYFKIIYLLYILWILKIGMTGFEFSLAYLYSLFTGYYYSLLSILIIPSTLLLCNNIQFLRNALKYIVIFDVVYLILDIFYFSIISDGFFTEYHIRLFYMSNALLVLTYSYYNKKTKLIVLISFLVALGIAIITARRNLIFSVGLAAIFAYFLALTYKRISKLKKIFYSISSIIALGLIITLYFTGELTITKELAEKNRQENSREKVVADFYFDIYQSPKNFIFGKGINGTYYSQAIGDDNQQRSLIETGYLTYILKGGLIYLILHLMLLLPAVIKGIFKSNNSFAKGAGFLILISILEMYPSGNSEARFYYIIVWMCVGLCYNEKFLAYNNIQIKHLLFSQNNLLYLRYRKNGVGKKIS